MRHYSLRLAVLIFSHPAERWQQLQEEELPWHWASTVEVTKEADMLQTQQKRLSRLSRDIAGLLTRKWMPPPVWHSESHLPFGPFALRFPCRECRPGLRVGGVVFFGSSSCPDTKAESVWKRVI